MKEFTFGQRLRYAFDNTMARGTIALIGWLGLVSLGVILVATLVIVVLGLSPVPLDAFQAFLGIMLQVMTPNPFDTSAGGVVYLLIMLIVTLAGVFLVSALIGVLNNGVEAKLEDLRKGRSLVVENNHTVILGWSDQVFTIIQELEVANENQKSPCVVVLAEKDKVEMDDELRERLGATGRTRVVTRTGSPINPHDLEIVNINGARSIIVLAPETDDRDAQVIKSVLAIVRNPKRRTEPPYHIVAPILEAKNLEVARLVGGEEAQIIETGDVISRVVVQTCRQAGLSVVYRELLDFAGDEIYFQEEPGLVGKTFGDALLAYEKSAVLGLLVERGRVVLNPAMDTCIQGGDKIIAVSADDDTVRLSGIADLQINTAAIRTPGPAVQRPEHTLILGWNWRAPRIINELESYVAPGSSVTVLADHDGGLAEINRSCGRLRNQRVTYHQGDTTDRARIEQLPLQTYDHVIVLAYSDVLDPQRADARTLVTLLHLRDLGGRRGAHFAITSEMIDDHNRQLAEVTRADDFIVSEQLISLMMAQISENKYLTAVFQDLFDPEGSEVYLKPAKDYVALGEPVNFYTVIESARRRHQCALGYRVLASANDPEKSYGVAVNPAKSERVTFAEGDKIMVLAED